jgi:hypothetical protein
LISTPHTAAVAGEFTGMSGTRAFNFAEDSRFEDFVFPRRRCIYRRV